jgi:hypothetical protein
LLLLNLSLDKQKWSLFENTLLHFDIGLSSYFTMPRQRRGAAPARSTPARPSTAPARPAPQKQQRPFSTATAPSAQAQQPPPAAAQQSQGPGLFGQMASTAA